jgi:hypothetical protein
MDWWIMPILSLLVAVPRVWPQHARQRAMRGIAALLVLIYTTNFVASGVPFWRAAAHAQTVLTSSSGIDANQLWQAQPQLLMKELNALKPRVKSRPNVYAIAIAAQGSQQLFSREAQLALRVAAARFGGNYRGGVLLSNSAIDLADHPLATQGNIAAIARGIASRIDPVRDVAVIYLASHGSPEALLATDLPSHRSLTPISSTSLAEALTQAGIKRRVIIISACFAASWIPALASDDTIVITAAAKNRTSFGCDDTRRLTFFGEAFLEGPLARGASLHDAFETARSTVSKWEAQEQFQPSMPQAFVGRNMQALWTERAVRSRK